MRYLAAYLLLTLGGNSSPCVEDICAVLDSVGIECDNERAECLISHLAGKDINQLIAEGSAKLASVPGGGSGGAAAAPTAAAGSSGGSGPAPPPEDKPEEKEEESDEDMGFGLFD